MPKPTDPCTRGATPSVAQNALPDTFRDAIISFIPVLRAFAARLTGSRAEAEDLVQETLARAWQYGGSFDAGTNMKSWLCKILQNCFYKNAHRNRDLIQDSDGHFAAQQSISAPQEWTVMYSELLCALTQLTPDTRDALLLVVANGCTYEEAAKLAQCPVGTLKSRVNRAREHLNEMANARPAGRRTAVVGLEEQVA